MNKPVYFATDYIFACMDRRQKIMRLIIETLEDIGELEFRCTGAELVADENLVSLNFSVKKGYVCGDINIRGMIDMPLRLTAQYQSLAMWQLSPEVMTKVEHYLQSTSEKVNRAW